MQLYNKIANRKVIIPLAAFVAVILITASAMVFTSLKTITIVDEGQISEYKTFKSTVEAFLQQNDIIIGANDVIDKELTDKIKNKEVLNIRRGKLVNISVDNKSITFYSVAQTIGDALKQAEITLDEDDIVSVDLNKALETQNEIVINRVTHEIQTEQQPIDFGKIVRRNENMEIGSKVEVQRGRPGKREVSVKVTYVDGQETKREVLSETVVTEPVDHIIEEGSKNFFVTSRGERRTFKRVIYMTATAYTAGPESTGKNPGDPGYGMTATGTQVRPGVVAVDPRVIPLRSKLYVESLGSWPDYGYASAEDTGGAVKGDKIDLYFESLSEALRFGRRTVKVYVLD